MASGEVNWPDAVATMCFILTAGTCFLAWMWVQFWRGGDED